VANRWYARPTVTTFIARLDATGNGVKLAIKDLIDMEGLPTTAGCQAVADEAGPAASDAACLAGARRAGARIVGKANLQELALGVTGENPWFGTPVNPLDPRLVPGGSSSGCAVAVADGDADVAFGSDSGGSIRIPAACCGVSGLKTTWGRVSLEGVWPVSASFDTIGPMARDVAGLVRGMELLEPSFEMAPSRDGRIARFRPPADDSIDTAVDEALARSELEIEEIALPEWDEAATAATRLLLVDAFAGNRALLERAGDGIGDSARRRLRQGESVAPAVVDAARQTADIWKARLATLFERYDAIATPTLTIFPPPLGEGEVLLERRCTTPVNLAGVPALALPIPARGPLPASLQLIGPSMGEATLLAIGQRIEAAIT
jgi:amidase